MQINADFTRRTLLHSRQISWQDSPMKGVRRRPLDRIGDEVARATSIVSYDPKSRFSAHVHTGGEEFIVLEGVFQDEHGYYPAGSYIRNPPQSSHTPGSEAGCIIFVKLWQFDLADRRHVVIDMNALSLESDASRPGVRGATLFEDDREQVCVEQWDAGSTVSVDVAGGAEFLVLDGDFTETGERLATHSWLRVPVAGTFRATAGDTGARVWMKTGHLRHVEEERARIV